MRATKQQLLDKLERLQRQIDEYERSADQHQRVNQAPREGAAQLSLIVDHLPALISYVDSDRRYRFVNSAYEKWFGYGQREVEGRYVKEVLGETAYQAIEKYVTRALAGELVTYEAAVPYRDGRERYIDATYFPDFTQDGKVGGFFALVDDISERKRAERELEESREILRALADNLPEFISLKDSEGRFLFVNKRFEEWVCVDRNDIVGKTVHDIYSAEQAAEFAALDRNAIASRSVLSNEVDLHYPDGNTRAVVRTRFPVISSDGEVLGLGTINIDVSEHKRIERALSQARDELERRVAERTVELRNANETLQRAQFALDHASDSAIWVDRDGRIVYANTATGMMLGYSREELLTLRVPDFDPDASLDDFSRSFERTKARGPYTFEARHRSKAGNDIPVEVSVHYMRFGDDELMCSYSRDITERKRAEEALLASEEAKKALLTATEDSIFLLTRDGTVLEANQAGAERLGATVEDILGKSIFELMPPDVGKPRRALLARLDAGEALDFQDQRAGTWFENRVHPVSFKDGKVERFAVFARDITERKQAEEARREIEERFRAIVDNSPAAIYLKDLEGRFRLVNRKFEEWYGVPAATALGKTSRDIFPDQFTENYMAQDREVMESMKVFEREHEIPFANGEIRRVSVTKFPVLDAGGGPVGVGTIDVDVTQHRAIEEQLSQAQKMEAVGQLTGGVAHDFNNLLAVIMGNTELLQDRLGKGDKSLSAIFRAATRGAELTQRLLAFSRRQPLQARAIDVGALVDEMGDLLRRTLGETIRVEIAPEPGLWHAQIDPGQLENTILNLALNARDAMRKGGKLSIESSNATLDEAYAASHMEVSPGDYVLITVSDSGSGMSEEILAHALEPFFTTKDVGEGSGLGLAMVYGFAKQSGGDLVIHSEEGLGTTIELYLPRAVDSGDQTEPSAKTEMMPRGQGETVLVVEDESEVRTLAEAVLGFLGYRALAAKDGREGLEILEKEPKIDLLLSDVVLPGGMSGPDLAKEAMRRVAELKVLFMSGHAESVVDHHSPLPEGADLMNKPFRRLELARMVRAALDH